MKAKEIYEQTLDSIVKALEKGVKPWVAGWQGGIPYNLLTRHLYSGMNILILWAVAERKSYQHQAWLTLKQANRLGGKIRKGAKATQCLFYKRTARDEVEDEEEGKRKFKSFLSAFSLFNVEQVEGLPEGILPSARRAPSMGPDMAETALEIKELIRRHGAVVKTGGGRACFDPSLDVIHMPAFNDFDSAENYYSTLLHELTHWTGHEKRLNRGFPFGRRSLEYAFEELVAEMGSAFCCASFGISGMIENHASYIDGWLKIADEDRRALGRAAAQASEAHQYLMAVLDVPAEAAATPLPEAA